MLRCIFLDLCLLKTNRLCSFVIGNMDMLTYTFKPTCQYNYRKDKPTLCNKSIAFCVELSKQDNEFILKSSVKCDDITVIDNGFWKHNNKNIDEFMKLICKHKVNIVKELKEYVNSREKESANHLFCAVLAYLYKNYLISHEFVFGNFIPQK